MESQVQNIYEEQVLSPPVPNARQEAEQECLFTWAKNSTNSDSYALWKEKKNI